MKRALVVGINDYRQAPLTGCVNDANAVGDLLQKHGNGDSNIRVTRLLSSEEVVGTGALNEAAEELFQGDAELIVFYFSGHGVMNRETGAGYLLSQDASKGALGLSMADLMNMANKAYPHVSSTLIVLDCCHGGFVGEVPALASQDVSIIGTGVTIMTATQRDGTALDGAKHSLFTQLLVDGLAGGAADILGNITPAALYAHIDRALGPIGRRPVYKANVQTFISLRQVAPKVSREFLRELHKLFPDPAAVLPLEPAHEPDRSPLPQELIDTPPDPELNRIFRGLQDCNRVGLVVPVVERDMYYAAVRSRGCRLTALGTHYRMLAENGDI